MKSIYLCLLAATMLTSFQTIDHMPELTTQERQQAVELLQQTRDFFLQETEGLSSEQTSFRSSPERWTIAECMEHIALAESVIFQLVKQSMSQPSDPSRRSEIKMTDEKLMAGMVDRSFKAQAPEIIRPVGKFTSSDQARAAFLKERNERIEFVRSTREDLRNRYATHPVFGTLDLYQWVLMIASHTKRHTLQIVEIKQTSGFPK